MSFKGIVKLLSGLVVLALPGFGQCFGLRPGSSEEDG